MKKLQNQNTGDATLPHAIHGGTGTRPKAGGAHDNFFKRMKWPRSLSFLFQLVSFTADSDLL